MGSWRKRLPHPALAFVVVAWGLNFSVIKVAYREIAPPAVGLFRYLWMLPLLAAWCLVAKQSLRYPPGMFWKTNYAGFVGSGAYMVLFLEGMRTAPTALAAIALATAPIMTAFFSVLAKQDRFSWKLVIGSLVAFAGVAFSVLGSHRGGGGSAFGVMLVVCAAALWAYSIILYRSLVGVMSPIRSLTLSFPGAAVALVPYGLLPLMQTEWSGLSGAAWLSMAYLIVIAGVGAFAAYYKGVADVGPAATSMTQYFVTPVAALFSALILHEAVPLNEIVGLFIVIAGVAITSKRALPPSQHGGENGMEMCDATYSSK